MNAVHVLLVSINLEILLQRIGGDPQWFIILNLFQRLHLQQRTELRVKYTSWPRAVLPLSIRPFHFRRETTKMACTVSLEDSKRDDSWPGLDSKHHQRARNLPKI